VQEPSVSFADVTTHVVSACAAGLATPLNTRTPATTAAHSTAVWDLTVLLMMV
jgi:hypothetical protein